MQKLEVHVSISPQLSTPTLTTQDTRHKHNTQETTPKIEIPRGTSTTLLQQ